MVLLPSLRAMLLSRLVSHHQASQISNSSFKDTNLSGANLEFSYFKNCNFEGADLSDAIVTGAVFENCDLNSFTPPNRSNYRTPTDFGTNIHPRRVSAAEARRRIKLAEKKALIEAGASIFEHQE